MSSPNANVSTTDRLRKLRDVMLTDLVERDDAVRLALLAALAGEHLLLLGPPGTAKSLVASRLKLAFAGGRHFERLLTRFSVPEELFGPYSIKGLEQDQYVRQIDGYLPTVAIAFLDEIFKANSAILNALLTLLNERVFDNGTERLKTPLVAVVGASNELPVDPDTGEISEELHALYDRFLLRLHVDPVSAKGFERLLDLRGEPLPEIASELRLTVADLTAIRAASDRATLAPEVKALLVELRTFCQAKGISVSDRRWRKIVKLLQTSAATHGRNEASIWDCWLLQHCVWQLPEQREKVYRWYTEHVGANRVMDPSRLTRIVLNFERHLKQDKDGKEQDRDEFGRLVFVDEEGERTLKSKDRKRARRSKQPLFLAPADAYETDPYYRSSEAVDRANHGKGYTLGELDELYTQQRVQFRNWSKRESYVGEKSNWAFRDGDNKELNVPKRHKGAYVTHQVGECVQLAAEVDSYRTDLGRHVASLDETVSTHLWLDPAFREPATAQLKQSGLKAEELVDRVKKLINGFQDLPLEQDFKELPDDAEPEAEEP